MNADREAPFSRCFDKANEFDVLVPLDGLSAAGRMNALKGKAHTDTNIRRVAKSQRTRKKEEGR